MLVLGHAGITLGIATALEAIRSKTLFTKAHESPHAPSSAKDALPNHIMDCKRISLFSNLARCMDIRILLVGSLLPDIIDKPVGHFIFRNIFANGRIFCHSFLFLCFIFLAGIILYYRRRQNWLLVLSFGSFIHLVLDQMWLTPQTLFWPLYGLAFPRGDPDPLHWLGGIISALFADPSTCIPEVIGAAILGIFLWQLIRAKAIGSFIRKGKVE
jgi:inner membrane protein